MAIYALDDATPRLDAAAWVADSAQVMGNVTLAADTSIWFGTVVRGDTESITIGRGSNIQDGSVLHADVGVIKTSMTSFSDGMDRLTKAVTQLAVVEERQTHAQQAQERLFKAHDEIRVDVKAVAARVSELEKSEPGQTRAAEWVDRAVWAAASAAVMMAAAKAGLF